MNDVWSALSEGSRPDARVAKEWLAGLGRNRGAPVEVLVSLFDAGGDTSFLYRADVPAGVLDAAVVHPSKFVWGRAAESGRLSRDQWDRLLAASAGLPRHHFLAEMAEEQVDSRPGVGFGVDRAPSPESRPPATPAEIAAMADTVPDITADSHDSALWWVVALHDDAAAMRQLASSAKLLIRRSVARAVHLPPDVVDLLARDKDRVVGLFLAESCDDATADVLVDVWAWWSGSLSFPGRPRNHPNFPRDDLLRFADDPCPRVRLLALDDPASGDDLVERFSRDPDSEVRGRAAEDPRLSPDSAVRLTQETAHEVYEPARRNPALPPAYLVSLLLDEHSARDAAQNPALPVSVMHRMIALAGKEKGPHVHA